MTALVAIAISPDVTCTGFIYENLNLLLESIDDYEIVAINDKNRLIEKFAQEKGKKVSSKSYSNRVGARQSLKNATHLVAFWSGNDLQDLIFTAYTNRLRLKVFPISVTSVVNKDSGQQFDIYIGRGSPLGNPFPIEHGTDKDRMHVIERYREHFYSNIVSDPEMKRYIESLRGLKLGCHCKPLPCHGDVIAEYLNNEQPEQ